jgi:hypothetical protein
VQENLFLPAGANFIAFQFVDSRQPCDIEKSGNSSGLIAIQFGANENEVAHVDF